MVQLAKVNLPTLKKTGSHYLMRIAVAALGQQSRHTDARGGACVTKPLAG